jgi:hypothetical protein
MENGGSAEDALRSWISGHSEGTEELGSATFTILDRYPMKYCKPRFAVSIHLLLTPTMADCDLAAF